MIRRWACWFGVAAMIAAAMGAPAAEPAPTGAPGATGSAGVTAATGAAPPAAAADAGAPRIRLDMPVGRQLVYAVSYDFNNTQKRSEGEVRERLQSAIQTRLTIEAANPDGSFDVLMRILAAAAGYERTDADGVQSVTKFDTQPRPEGVGRTGGLRLAPPLLAANIRFRIGLEGRISNLTGLDDVLAVVKELDASDKKLLGFLTNPSTLEGVINPIFSGDGVLNDDQGLPRKLGGTWTAQRMVPLQPGDLVSQNRFEITRLDGQRADVHGKLTVTFQPVERGLPGPMPQVTVTEGYGQTDLAWNTATHRLESRTSTVAIGLLIQNSDRLVDQRQQTTIEITSLPDNWDPDKAMDEHRKLNSPPKPE
ncbi:MAG: hypothetical protein IBJ11_10405 [Phycisphaerales bacterium]|nr:hypothetical protein [Phycisphaerales bacterium]